MSDLLPYEQQLQQQWTDIPLPEENAAWDDMRRRLEEDDDDGGFFFWWRPGCAWWGLLLVAIGLGWWLLQPGRKPVNEAREMKQDSMVSVDKNNSYRKDSSQLTTNKNTYDHNKPSDTNAGEQAPVNIPSTGARELNEEKNTADRSDPEIPASVNGKKGRSGETNAMPVNNPTRRLTSKNRNNRQRSNDAPVNRTNTAHSVNKSRMPADPIAVPDSAAIDPATGNLPHTIDSITSLQLPATKSVDSTVASQVKKNPAKKTDSNLSTGKTPNPAKRTKQQQLFFSTGIAMQQQLPIAGQKATPYNSVGRKSSLADYIPSLYVRLHKKDKWFFQGEFRYGAPQYSKEFLYQQETLPDTTINPPFTTSTSFKLKKTFYHQLPLSFHYHVLPNWTVGAGVIWNKFYAAISDKETIKRDNVNQVDSILFKGIVSLKKDTAGNFASSYFQAVFETQYQWKRLSIGARYAFGLQPYIRFTLPGLGTKEEKNSSFQAFIRFELWRSERKKNGD